MNIFFHTPISNFEKNKATYNLIRRMILTQGFDLSFDWVTELENHKLKKIEPNSKKLLQKSIEAINTSELCVCEATNFSFETGYLLSYAISTKKPTLVLLEKDGVLNKEVEDLIQKHASDYITIVKYYAQDLEKIIANFITSNKNEPVSRFNLMLERNQRDYLDWADRFYKQSKSNIIRELINQQIKNDMHYKRFRENVT